MKSWTKMTNDELVQHLELWLVLDGKISTEVQKTFFEEVIWRLAIANAEYTSNIQEEEDENG